MAGLMILMAGTFWGGKDGQVMESLMQEGDREISPFKG